jgi:hypothetical protein
MENAQELEAILLQTLSFYEPMSFSKIVFDIDTELLKTYPQFDRDQMLLILTSLEKRGLVKRSGQGTESQWIRILRKRTMVKRVLSFFNGFFKVK